MPIRTRRRTFSNSYKLTDAMTNISYICKDYDKFTDYRIEIKNTFKFNSRNSKIMSDTKRLSLEDKITNYKSFQKSYERWWVSHFIL